MNKVKMAAVAVMLSFAVAAPAYADNKCASNYYGLAKQSCVNQVNLEDMRVKRGEVVEYDNKTQIKLRVEDQAPTQGRPIYGKDVYIDVTSLKGQDGIDGERGNRGRKGETGSQGVQGVAGNNGINGLNGNNGIDGDVGSQGEQGIAGIQGEKGDQGIAGKQGEKGDQGMTGLDGKQGEKGMTGLDGKQGEKGVADEEKLQEIADGITNNRTDITKNTTSITELKDEMFNSNTKSINSENSMNQRIDGVMNDMRYMDKNLSAGIASSIAIGQHQFDPSFKGGQVSLSGGFYNGQNAVSLAVGVPVGERAFLSASIAADSGSYGESGGVGITIQLP